MTDIKVTLAVEDRAENQERLSISEIVPRIVAERKSFVDVTEESLLEEIANCVADSDDHVKDEVDEPDESVFDQHRMKLLENVKAAYNESALALDFVSLLISSVRPTSASTSMSPHLKTHIPVGSLGADRVPAPQVVNEPGVGIGWKIESLTNARDSLKNCASRLRTEATKEKTYWEGVAAIAATGEVLFKVRNSDTRGLGIKYGFGDAGSKYRDPGIGVLKRSNAGTVDFEPKEEVQKKFVRVTIKSEEGDVVKSVSDVYTRDSKPPTDPTLAAIHETRHALFEEELFFETAREARLLTSRRVTVADGCVTIDLGDGDIIVIEWVEVPAEPVTTFSASPANLFVLALRLLLANAHRQQLEKMRTPPAPLQSKGGPNPNPPLPILRPLLAHILHKRLVSRARRSLYLLSTTHAGLSFDITTDSSGETSSLGRLMAAPVSNLKIKFGDRENAKVVIPSPLQTHQSMFDVTMFKGETQETVTSHTGFHELVELEEWVRWAAEKASLTSEAKQAK